MARPREFDETQVLDAALSVFWERGFEGASLELLTEATGLSRASLYGAFGDKLGLFERVLERYMDRFDGLDSSLVESTSVREGIRAFLLRWLEITCSDKGPRGCFIQLSASIGPEDNDVARRVVDRNSRHVQRLLEAAIVRGQRSGELDPTADPVQLGGLFTVVLQGLSTAARNGRSRDELAGVVDAAVATLGLGPSGSRSQRDRQRALRPDESAR